MPAIASIGNALPKVQYSQEEILLEMQKFYRPGPEEGEAMAAVFHNSRVERRYMVQPFGKILALSGFTERNRIYTEAALELAACATRSCLEAADCPPSQVDGIFLVSTTGFAVPSLDAYLIQQLEFLPTIRRFPLFGWGCTGGVSGLGAAFEFTRADPTRRALLVTVELCSLAFQAQDRTKKAVVANAIFNDGAAAVLVEGDQARGGRRGPRILSVRGHLFPETYSMMGWEQKDSGLQVILSPEIPKLVRKESRAFVEGLLSPHRMKVEELPFVLAHPGGAKVLAALEESLELKPEQTQLAWESLRQFGNMSSASVFFTLKAALQAPPAPGSLSPMTAFGPGFSAEGAVLQW